jgi:hypothetical protein
VSPSLSSARLGSSVFNLRMENRCPGQLERGHTRNAAESRPLSKNRSRAGQSRFLIHGQLKRDWYRANGATQCMQTGTALNQSLGHVLSFAVLNDRNGLNLCGNASGSGNDGGYAPVRGASATKRELRCPVR